MESSKTPSSLFMCCTHLPIVYVCVPLFEHVLGLLQRYSSIFDLDSNVWSTIGKHDVHYFLLSGACFPCISGIAFFCFMRQIGSALSSMKCIRLSLSGGKKQRINVKKGKQELVWFLFFVIFHCMRSWYDVLHVQGENIEITEKTALVHLECGLDHVTILLTCATCILRFSVSFLKKQYQKLNTALGQE